MTKGPKTPDDAGLNVSAFLMREVELISSGHWSIEAFLAENSTDEGRAWLTNQPPEEPLDLACRFDD